MSINDEGDTIPAIGPMSEPNSEHPEQPEANVDPVLDASVSAEALAAGLADGFVASDIPVFTQADESPRPIPANARRLLKLPVKVVVYLAQKKIEVEQLLAISPGALITFNKPCEDLLDLYVNNHRYCRGEAVKIGEKFGIKISEVGVVDVRESPILV